MGGTRGFARGLLGFALLCVAGAVGAQTTETETALTKTVLTEEAQAKRWHLSIQEWDEYKTLMQGPRGVWSPNLDPVTVLGIHAETDADRKRYAELLVTIEFERVEKELLFQRAYDDAARRFSERGSRGSGRRRADRNACAGKRKNRVRRVDRSESLSDLPQGARAPDENTHP